MKFHINYLYAYKKQVNQLKEELLHLQDVAEVTADIDDVEALSKSLEELKIVVDNLPLA